ncbi:MAG: O-antigen ligase family protein [Gaiellales bacterium]
MQSSSTASSALAGRRSERWSERVQQVGAGIATFAVLAAVAAANGGYDPPSWGLATVLLLTVAGVALAVRPELALSRPELVMLASFFALTAWMLASALWSDDAGASFLAAERGLVYVAALTAVFVLARPRMVVGLLAGCLAAAVATVMNGLVGLIVPSTVAVHGVAQTGRMAAPVGYWNGLAVVAAIGLIIGCGLAARSSTAAGRLAALAPLPVLAVGLYLTFSRGGWLALAFGLVAMLLLETRRWQLACVLTACAPALALDVLVTAGSPALTHVGSPLGAATSQGHRLGLTIAATLPLMAAAAVATLWIERRWSPSPRVTRIARVLALVTVLAVAASPVVVYGSPAAVAQHLYDDFNARAPGGFRAGRSLNARLFSLSGNGRIALWRAAFSDYHRHPLVGSGGGTYERWWLGHRPSTLKVRNAHSLYLETLAELGPAGLVVLILAMGTPLVVAVRRRSSPLIAVAAAAYLAYVLHAGVDWDFQLPGVTLFGLACGAAVLVGTRMGSVWWVRPAWRWAAMAAAALLVVVSLGALRGNLALDRSTQAATAQNWNAAIADARTAHTWQPWSDAPLVALGEAELGAGRFGAATAAFHQATGLAPDDWQAWFGLARSTTGAERRQAVQRALELNPREPVVVVLAQASGSP